MRKTYACEYTPLEKVTHQKFRKQAVKGKIIPECLHQLRMQLHDMDFKVYLQVVTWKYLNTSLLELAGRGWELDSYRKLKFTKSKSGIICDKLLKDICCNCEEEEEEEEEEGGGGGGERKRERERASTYKMQLYNKCDVM